MQIFQQLNQAYLIACANHFNLVDFNKSARQLLKLTSPDIPQKDWQSTFLPAVAKAKSGQSSEICYNNLNIKLHFSFIEFEQKNYIAIHLELLKESLANADYFFSVLDNLGAYVYCKDKNYKYTYANQLVCELFEMSSEAIVGKTDCDLFGQESGNKLRFEYDSPVIEKGEVTMCEERNYIPHLDEFRYYHAVKKPLFDENGITCGLFGISIDVTEQKRLEKKYFESEQELSTILDNAGAYIFIKDRECRFTYINKRTQELFRKEMSEIIGKNNHELLGDIQGEEFSRTDLQVFSSGKKLTCIETFQLPDSVLYYWTVKIPLTNEKGQIDRFIGISTDITEQKELENSLLSANMALNEKVDEITDLKNELLHQASFDVLTGLYNRRYFEQAIAKLIKDRHKKPLVLLMLDADHFKEVNDKFGHSTGDQALSFLAEVMRKECRSSDLICRYGGEEFLIALPNTDLDQGLIRSEWIRQQINVQSTQKFPNLPPLSVSIGIAELKSDESDFSFLYRQADRAMYRAKEQGRNCSVVAHSS